MTDRKWSWTSVAEWQQDWVSRDPANRKAMDVEEMQRVFDEAVRQNMVQPDFSNPDEECGGYSGPPSYEARMQGDTFQQNADGSLSFTTNINLTDEPPFDLNEHKLEAGILASKFEVYSVVKQTVEAVLGTAAALSAEQKSSAEVRAEPPPIAEMIFTALLPKNRHDAMLGDMDERFALDCHSFGADRARRRYWGHVLNSLRPLLLRAFKKMRAVALLEVARRYFFG